MLDPADPAAFRALAHHALDDALDDIAIVRERPAWQRTPDAVRTSLCEPLPSEPATLADVYEQYARWIAAYDNGNRHPRFFGWVHGAGTPSGLVAEMLASALNANVGGRDHAAVDIERTVIAWSAELFGLPDAASGMLTSGTSLANLIAVVVARHARYGDPVRDHGVGMRRPVAYASRDAHRCVRAAFDISGLGRNAVRAVAVDSDGALRIDVLEAAIAADRVAGREPFMVVATAGSVDTGAFDDLAALADLCAREKLWLHVDGAFGALAVLSPEHRHLVRGIERADSIAFDFHKWLHVPYDAGCVLVRDGGAQRAAFRSPAAYLEPATRGTAAGEPWFADYGPELSRRFRALAIWFAFKEHGTRKLGAAIAQNCRLAKRLAERAVRVPELRLAAPVRLNVVCVRYDDGTLSPEGTDERNAQIVVDLQERGIAVPSTTRIDGRLAIRLCVINHRTSEADIDAVLEAIVASGSRVCAV